jgi:hypothetical protein
MKTPGQIPFQIRKENTHSDDMNDNMFVVDIDINVWDNKQNILREMASSRFHSIYSMESVIQQSVLDVIIINRFIRKSCCFINSE